MFLIISFLLFNKKNEWVSHDSGPHRSTVRDCCSFLVGTEVGLSRRLLQFTLIWWVWRFHISFGMAWQLKQARLPQALWEARGKQTPRAFWQRGWVPSFEMSGLIPIHAAELFCPFAAKQVDLKVAVNQLLPPGSSFVLLRLFQNNHSL